MIIPLTISLFGDIIYDSYICENTVFLSFYFLNASISGKDCGSGMSSDSTGPVMVAGFNQSKKHIKGGTAKTVFLASDAEGKIISAVKELCRTYGVELDSMHTKSELGALCGIDVDCAVCVVLK